MNAKLNTSMAANAAFNGIVEKTDCFFIENIPLRSFPPSGLY
jgi:hypothetical protein